MPAKFHLCASVSRNCSKNLAIGYPSNGDRRSHTAFDGRKLTGTLAEVFEEVVGDGARR